LLKLAHPLIPFVTEELWLELNRHTGRSSETVMREPFPAAEDVPFDSEAEAEIGWLQAFVNGVRQIRGEMNLARSTPLAALLADASELDRARAGRHAGELKRMAGLENIDVAPPGGVKGAATALVGGMRVLVPLAGLIDVAAERDRLAKLLAKTRDDFAKARRKLENRDFVANAPAEIVAKENARVAEFEERALKLTQQLTRLAELG
jgi:valyl-tRNA synthetase